MGDKSDQDLQNTDQPAEDPPVREPRKGRLFMAEMTLDDGRSTKVRIRNLSSKGLGGIAETPVRPEQTGQLILAGIGHVTGRIAWVRGQNFGMEFHHPIDAELARMNSAASETKSDFVVPDRFRPVTSHKRPGFRVR